MQPVWRPRGFPRDSLVFLSFDTTVILLQCCYSETPLSLLLFPPKIISSSFPWLHHVLQSKQQEIKYKTGINSMKIHVNYRKIHIRKCIYFGTYRVARTVIASLLDAHFQVSVSLFYQKNIYSFVT